MAFKFLLMGMFFSSCQAFAQSLLSADPSLPPGAFSVSEEPHEMQVLHSGMMALEKRLQLIDSATKTIEVEYFMFDTDHSGRLLAQALVRKARTGVKVRFLVDDTPLIKSIDKSIYTVLKKNNIEVRYYNNAWLFQFNKLNHRSHKKSLIIDDQEAIVGGRNIGDEYFDMHKEFNYLDRDVYVRGTIVRPIRESFDAYWRQSKKGKLLARPTLQQFGFQSEKQARQESSRSSHSRNVYRQYQNQLRSYEKKIERANRVVTADHSDLEIREQIRQKAEPELAKEPIETCNETYFLADLPGYKERHRVVYNKLRHFINSAKTNITAESLYLVLSSVSPEFQNALERGVEMDLVTNSLASSGNPLAIGSFYFGAKELIRRGANLYTYNGEYPVHIDTLFNESKEAQWGLHTKSFVIDDHTTIFTSYNLDPRSKNINAEMALICRGNTQLAKTVKDNIALRMQYAEKLRADGHPVNGQGKHFGVSLTKKIVYYISKPFAKIFEFLL
jgi:putative cardiolipin synthase